MQRREQTPARPRWKGETWRWGCRPPWGPRDTHLPPCEKSTREPVSHKDTSLSMLRHFCIFFYLKNSAHSFSTFPAWPCSRCWGYCSVAFSQKWGYTMHLYHNPPLMSRTCCSLYIFGHLGCFHVFLRTKNSVQWNIFVIIILCEHISHRPSKWYCHITVPEPTLASLVFWKIQLNSKWTFIQMPLVLKVIILSEEIAVSSSICVIHTTGTTQGSRGSSLNPRKAGTTSIALRPRSPKLLLGKL